MKNRKTALASSLMTVLAVLLAFAACNIPDGGITLITPSAVAVTGVSLNKSSTGLLVGETETLFTVITPSNATNQNVTWSSSNTAVATVSNGVVTGVSKGEATVTVTTVDGDKTASCKVTVREIAIPVTGISLNKVSTNLTVGDTETLFTAITPSNATNQNVTWISGNPAVATVSADGAVTGISAGTATIMVATKDGGYQAICAVTVSPDVIHPIGISLNKESTSLVVDGTETLFAVITPANATNQNVTWISGNPAVATVSADGTVTGGSDGTATIIVITQDGGYQASCTVTVSSVVVPVTGISLNKASANLALGDMETLFAAITPANATNQSVTWMSTDTYVATVSGSGEVLAKNAGTTTITVTAADGGSQASCTVTVTGNGVIDNLITETRYQAAPYEGTDEDRFKYSYSYNGLDFYYIYLGQLKNIPLFSGMEYEHTGLTYVYTYTKADEETISKAVSKSSEETVSVSKEHTVSKTDGVKAGFEISTSFGMLFFSGELKISAEYNWSQTISNTSSVQKTTSLTNTVEEGTSRTKTTQETASITLTKEDRPGVYRFTCFTSSDVYLYVIRDPARPDEIYYEFKEYITPGYRWKMDYSQTGDFNKNDATKFELDISILDRLPDTKLDLSDSTPPPVDPNTFTVTNTAEWNSALTTIKNGGNGIAENPKTYTITVNGNISVPGSSYTSNSFGDVSNVKVTLKGNGILSLGTRGIILNIVDFQTVRIDSANLTLQGFSGSDNNAPVINVKGGTFELNDGTISGNSGNGSGNGGGVDVVKSDKIEKKGGTFVMTGGTITGNTSDWGGGVCVNGEGTSFTMSGGTITKNHAYNENGGGVYVAGNDARFTMTGGTISGNTSVGRGAGVYVGGNSGGIFTMNGGTISGNTSKNCGGGVYLSPLGKFTITGGTISGNVAAGYGGGVCINYDGFFSKSGDSTIYGNDAASILKNTATNGTSLPKVYGHAVFWVYPTANSDYGLYRDTTSGPNNDMKFPDKIPDAGKTDGTWTRR